MSKAGILYIRNITEELESVIEEVMEKNRFKTKNSAVRHMIENYPLSLLTIEKLKTKIKGLEEEIYNLEDELEDFRNLGRSLKNLIDKI